MSVASARLQVRKRSGQVTEYQKQKIEQAVRLCFINGCNRPDDEGTQRLCAKVAERVERTLRHIAGPVEVELIQDLVEQALLVCGERDAARQYILYRDEHRRLRETLAVLPAHVEAVRDDDRYFPTELSRFQHYNKYARFVDAEGRRETVTELAERNINFFDWHLARHGMPTLEPALRRQLRDAILYAHAAPSMRLMQMAGPAAQRCSAHIYNCAFAGISDLTYFSEALYISMAGVGIGFSCEGRFVQQLPQIAYAREGATPDTFRVPDTTEGWCDSVRTLAERLTGGHDLNVVYDDIRPAGSRLRTKGGTASGPGPLRMLHDQMRRLFRAQQGLRLRDIDVHDIMCFIGRIGQMGNVRRGAEISLSDLDSRLMAEAKMGWFWQDPMRVQRTVANNSAVYNAKPSAEVFMAEWLNLVRSKSGERGIFNRGSLKHQLPARRQALYTEPVAWGLNPCGEVILHPDGQFCNLSQAICRGDDTEETLQAKVELATIFGTIQSTMTDFNYLRPRWKDSCDREHLLGVDLGGAMDCPLLRRDNLERGALLARLQQRVLKVNRAWSAKLGIEPSTATTVIKPGGNSGARWNIGQSMSGWLSQYMIRYVEVSNVDPICGFLKDVGVPREVCYRDPATSVFAFPISAPPGAMIVGDPVVDAAGQIVATKPRRTALLQLEDWLAFKRDWTEHNPSSTIYVLDDEWLAVGAWVYDHWDEVGGLAFLPFDGTVYPQMPFTPVTAQAYDALMDRFPARIPWEKLARYEDGRDHRSAEPACSGGACELREP